MRSKLLTLAGGLTLLSVLGKFYAVPAIAQAVHAALVQYRDSPPRQPFTVRSTITPSLIEKITPITFPTVPAGKRLIVTSVTGTVNIVLPSAEMCVMAMTTSNGHESYQALTLTSDFAAQGVNTYSGTTALHLPLDPGDTGTVGFTSVQPFKSATVIFTGYMIDVP
jgi:hypothetical protein